MFTIFNLVLASNLNSNSTFFELWLSLPALGRQSDGRLLEKQFAILSGDDPRADRHQVHLFLRFDRGLTGNGSHGIITGRVPLQLSISHICRREIVHL